MSNSHARSAMLLADRRIRRQTTFAIKVTAIGQHSPEALCGALETWLDQHLRALNCGIERDGSIRIHDTFDLIR